MTKDDYRHFVCIVAGDNPDAMMKEYDKSKIVDKYVIYKYEDAEFLKQKYLSTYKSLLELNDNELDKAYINATISDIEQMTSDEFYETITEGMDIDKDTNNAVSNLNKNGKWSSYKIGNMMSLPFLTKDGREVFQEKKNNIDWKSIHLGGGHIYSRAWEMVMEHSKPTNDYEKQIYENMKDKETYFQKFENKENYIISNTAFWGYAFLSDMTGWKDASETNQFVWMKNFYDLFIKNLPEDTLLTIYECVK